MQENSGKNLTHDLLLYNCNDFSMTIKNIYNAYKDTHMRVALCGKCISLDVRETKYKNQYFLQIGTQKTNKICKQLDSR